MFVLPHTLSLITTHQCTAACDHCCFHCTPRVTKAIPFERMQSLIDEAAGMPSMRVVVFTGGECFLLRDKLDELIERATAHDLITRCVTNGYWATSRQAADKRVARLVTSGLKEINFSTGTFHAQYVPVERIVHGARACVLAGLTTLINIEICDQSELDPQSITAHPDLYSLIVARKLIVQRNVWIENKGQTTLTHPPEHSRFASHRKEGCSTVLDVLAVTPDQSLVACCGLHMEKIPELHIGSVANKPMSEVIKSTPDDFLKIWIHVEGPERILEFVKEHLPEYELPTHSVHPCQTCLLLYTDARARSVIAEHYREVEERVVNQFMAGISVRYLNSKIEAAHAGELISQYAEPSGQRSEVRHRRDQAQHGRGMR